MRRLAAFGLALALIGCAPQQAAGLVPRLALRAQLGRSLADPPEAAWDWSVQATLTWRERSLAPAVDDEFVPPLAPDAIECAEPLLCEWEEREARDALALEEGEP
jgi:hypothetical protein